MVIDALKRIIKPVYRVVLDMQSGYVYIQRQNIFGRWRYVQDGLGAIELTSVAAAFAVIHHFHEVRSYDVSLYVDFDGDSFLSI